MTLSKLTYSLYEIPLRLERPTKAYHYELERGLKGSTEREKLIVPVGNRDVFLRLVQNFSTTL